MTYYGEQPEPEPPGPRLSFDLKVDSFDTSRFYEDVVNRAVENFVGSAWSPTELGRRVQAAVSEKVTERLNVVLEEAVAALLSKPIQKFDTLGNPVGVPTAVEDIIRDGATLFLSETVDRQGRATRDAYGDTKTRLAHIVEEKIVAGLRKEMEAEASKVRAELIRRASDAAAAVLVELGRGR